MSKEVEIYEVEGMMDGADYIPLEYTEEEMAEICATLECDDMTDEHTQYIDEEVIS